MIHVQFIYKNSQYLRLILTTLKSYEFGHFNEMGVCLKNNSIHALMYAIPAHSLKNYAQFISFYNSIIESYTNYSY